MGKSTVNGHFQLQTVSSPEGTVKTDLVSYGSFSRNDKGFFLECPGYRPVMAQAEFMASDCPRASDHHDLTEPHRTLDASGLPGA